MNNTLHLFASIINQEINNIPASMWNAARELYGVPIDENPVTLTLLKHLRDILFSSGEYIVDKQNTLVVITDKQNYLWMTGT